MSLGLVSDVSSDQVRGRVLVACKDISQPGIASPVDYGWASPVFICASSLCFALAMAGSGKQSRQRPLLDAEAYIHGRNLTRMLVQASLIRSG